VREPDVQEVISLIIKETHLPYRDTWMEALRNGSLDAHLAVLLWQLPNLRSLHLEGVFFMESNLVRGGRRAVRPRRSSLLGPARA
jgi:hypothetical protein